MPLRPHCANVTPLHLCATTASSLSHSDPSASLCHHLPPRFCATTALPLRHRDNAIHCATAPPLRHRATSAPPRHYCATTLPLRHRGPTTSLCHHAPLRHCSITAPPLRRFSPRHYCMIALPFGHRATTALSLCLRDTTAQLLFDLNHEPCARKIYLQFPHLYFQKNHD